MGLGIYIKSSSSYSAISEVYSISKILGGEAMQWIGIGMIVAGILTACLAAFGFLGILKKKDNKYLNLLYLFRCCFTKSMFFICIYHFSYSYSTF